MKDINKMEYLVKFLKICLLISYIGTPVFSNDISEAQEILKELGYDVGSIDGVVGKKTLKAINSLYFKNNLPEITSVRSKDLQILVEIKKNYGINTVKISAQAHLKKFYSKHGFVTKGKEYLEDGIPHVAMYLNIT